MLSSVTSIYIYIRLYLTKPSCFFLKRLLVPLCLWFYPLKIGRSFWSSWFASGQLANRALWFFHPHFKWMDTPRKLQHTPHTPSNPRKLWEESLYSLLVKVAFRGVFQFGVLKQPSRHPNNDELHMISFFQIYRLPFLNHPQKLTAGTWKWWFPIGISKLPRGPHFQVRCLFWGVYRLPFLNQK